jgi:hypothetical protein
MFDFSKLTEMSRIASEAKQIQQKQQAYQQEQIHLLKRMSEQLEEIITLLKRRV